MLVQGADKTHVYTELISSYSFYKDGFSYTLGLVPALERSSILSNYFE
jgi:hypothetical protein